MRKKEKKKQTMCRTAEMVKKAGARLCEPWLFGNLWKLESSVGIHMKIPVRAMYLHYPAVYYIGCVNSPLRPEGATTRDHANYVVLTI